ncbi:hypothetical protein B484DRAFT_435372 [Ochromonadaceae sp. CCMP2298]|nr:hypothetical protein B484DRAFT_435372 [Ochromonadaceae sp. CCMP2298]
MKRPSTRCTYWAAAPGEPAHRSYKNLDALAGVDTVVIFSSMRITDLQPLSNARVVKLLNCEAISDLSVLSSVTEHPRLNTHEAHFGWIGAMFNEPSNGSQHNCVMLELDEDSQPMPAYAHLDPRCNTGCIAIFGPLKKGDELLVRYNRKTNVRTHVRQGYKPTEAPTSGRKRERGTTLTEIEVARSAHEQRGVSMNVKRAAKKERKIMGLTARLAGAAAARAPTDLSST